VRVPGRYSPVVILIRKEALLTHKEKAGCG
jgi:hypothetical protein